MPKNAVVVLILILGLIATGLVFVFWGSPQMTQPTTLDSLGEKAENTPATAQPYNTPKPEKIVETTSSPSTVSTTAPEAQGYVVYSPEIAQAAASQRRVLFFYASWCPTCRPADKDITTRASEIPADLTILRVDYDQEAELKKKYGVTYQHTFVQVDANGNAIKKWNGGNLTDILRNIQ